MKSYTQSGRKLNFLTIFCLQKMDCKTSSQNDSIVNTVPSSSHNRIKITTKLEDKCHSKPSEIQLKASSISRDLKKKHTETGRKGGDIEQTGPTPHVIGRNWEGFLDCGGPQE